MSKSSSDGFPGGSVRLIQMVEDQAGKSNPCSSLVPLGLPRTAHPTVFSHPSPNNRLSNVTPRKCSAAHKYALPPNRTHQLTPTVRFSQSRGSQIPSSHCRFRSFLLHIVFETILVSNQGSRPRSTEASSSPRLRTIAPGPPGFSKSYQDRCHEAEWLVLQLTKLPKTHGHPSRRARSRPKVVGFGSNHHHTTNEYTIAKRPLPQIGGHHSPTGHGLFSKKYVLQFRVKKCLPLTEAISLRIPMFETRFGGAFFSSRIPKPQKLSPASSTVEVRRSQSASPGRCADLVWVSLGPMQQISKERLLDLLLADWDVPLHSWFFSLGLKFFLLLSEFLLSHSELFRRLSVSSSNQNLDCPTS